MAYSLKEQEASYKRAPVSSCSESRGLWLLVGVDLGQPQVNAGMSSLRQPSADDSAHLEFQSYNGRGDSQQGQIIQRVPLLANRNNGVTQQRDAADRDHHQGERVPESVDVQVKRKRNEQQAQHAERPWVAAHQLRQSCWPAWLIGDCVEILGMANSAGPSRSACGAERSVSVE